MVILLVVCVIILYVKGIQSQFCATATQYERYVLLDIITSPESVLRGKFTGRIRLDPHIVNFKYIDAMGLISTSPCLVFLAFDDV